MKSLWNYPKKEKKSLKWLSYFDCEPLLLNLWDKLWQ